ncbi:hypothetical protein INT45_000159 [Circinella minor]|uniref:Uncharacterized protein n=1 Tax=Circinella minor TaxID=1195481 RepID=A0A8H7S5U8_9FUNG|nr:hypothetical protein INT45_000159 [Circinella minor]
MDVGWKLYRDRQCKIDNYHGLSVNKCCLGALRCEECKSTFRPASSEGTIDSRALAEDEIKKRAQIEYRTWTKSADYKIFWNDRAKLNILLQTSKESIGFIGSVTHQRIKSLTTNATNNDDASNGPWLFRNKKITRLFKDCQSIVQYLVSKHETLPLESYINGLAALTHILVLNKHQHSPIVRKVFSDELLDDLTESMVSDDHPQRWLLQTVKENFTGNFVLSTAAAESMNYNLRVYEQEYMTMAKNINQVSLLENDFLELTLMSSSMNYNERRVIRELTNLIQKPPKLPLKSNDIISETKLWNICFDPLLSCLVCDSEKLVHLRWTNTNQNRGGKLRPDAVICERQQLEYESSIGHGEAKTSNISHFLFLAWLVKTFMFYEVANLHSPESLDDLPLLA